MPINKEINENIVADSIASKSMFTRDLKDSASTYALIMLLLCWKKNKEYIAQPLLYNYQDVFPTELSIGIPPMKKVQEIIDFRFWSYHLLLTNLRDATQGICINLVFKQVCLGP